MQNHHTYQIESLSTGKLLELLNKKEGYDSEFILKVKHEIKLREAIQAIEHPNTHVLNKTDKTNTKENTLLKILISSLFLIFISIFIYILEGSEVQYKETIGTVYEIKKVTSYSQGFEGQIVVLHGHIVRYYFEVDGQKYFGSTYIKNNNRNQYCIPKIKESNNKNVFAIKYESNNINANNLNLSPLRQNK
ncbi:MAG: hypothetical protein PF448_00315 [Bacteroidales bacterium]|jgi:hypothetical protein|nr:hypothetical protein [Bacteroidales bacterium]